MIIISDSLAIWSSHQQHRIVGDPSGLFWHKLKKVIRYRGGSMSGPFAVSPDGKVYCQVYGYGTSWGQYHIDYKFIVSYELVNPVLTKRIAQSAETISAVTEMAKVPGFVWRWSQKSRPLLHEYSRQIRWLLQYFQPQSGIQNFIPNDQSMEGFRLGLLTLMLLLHGNLPSLMAVNFQALIAVSVMDCNFLLMNPKSSSQPLQTIIPTMLLHYVYFLAGNRKCNQTR